MSKFTSIALAAITATPPIKVWADFILPLASDGYEPGCCMTGPDPNGDGFLAIRTGPGSKYRKKGEGYNGDIIVVQSEPTTDFQKYNTDFQTYNRAGKNVDILKRARTKNS